MLSTELINEIVAFHNVMTFPGIRIKAPMAGPSYHDALDFPALVCCPIYQPYVIDTAGPDVRMHFCYSCEVGSTEEVCWFCGGHTERLSPVAWAMVARQPDWHQQSHFDQRLSSDPMPLVEFEGVFDG